MPNGRPSVEALPAASVVRAERPVGLHLMSELGPPVAALPAFGEARLLAGVDLAPALPPAPAEERPAAAARRARRLAERYGGWLRAPLEPFLRFHPRTEAAGRWYSLQVRFGPWQLQGVGRGDELLCLLLARPLTGDAALGPGGHPRRRPVGPVAPLVATALPGLGELADRSASAPRNLFDTVLVSVGARVRAGVRERLDAEHRSMADEPRWFYGVRVDVVDGRRPPWEEGLA